MARRNTLKPNILFQLKKQNTNRNGIDNLGYILKDKDCVTLDVLIIKIMKFIGFFYFCGELILFLVQVDGILWLQLIAGSDLILSASFS